MSALDDLARHEEWMRHHYRATAQSLLADLDRLSLELLYRNAPAADLDAAAVAVESVERIANDAS